MSLEFIDGFDHYTSGANMAKKWTDIGNTSPNQTGRFGSGTGLSIMSTHSLQATHPM